MKSVIIDGIKVKISKDIFKDTEFNRLLVKANVLQKKFNDIEDEEEQWELLDELYTVSDRTYTLVYGKKQFERIVRELRAKHKGSVTDAQLSEFFAKVTQKINSDSKK